MLTAISPIWFIVCYLAALVAIVARLPRKSMRQALVVAWTAAGLLLQTAYLVEHARRAVLLHGAPLSGWHHWIVITAWGLSLVFLVIQLRRPRVSVGLFVLPLVLGLIFVACGIPTENTFPTAQAGRVWGMIHGIALMLGTVTVFVGFAAGVMYLVQSSRLKRKRMPVMNLRLPNLEWLERINERSLLVSSVLLASGLLAGIVLNLIRHAEDPNSMPWNDPVVVLSGVLFLWLLGSCIFNWIYRPARVGRKVAYLTVANFVFLFLVLGMTLFGPSDHASHPKDGAAARRDVPLLVGIDNDVTLADEVWR